MDEPLKLPELPRAQDDIDTGAGRKDVYDASELRFYGLACARAALEEAAKVCWERSKNAPEAMAAEAMLCSAAIRDLRVGET